MASLSDRFAKLENKRSSGGSGQPKRSVSLSAPSHPKSSIGKPRNKPNNKHSNRNAGNRNGKPHTKGRHGKPKPKTPTSDDLDSQIDKYTMGTEAFTANKLDNQIDGYMKPAVEEASSAPES